MGDMERSGLPVGQIEICPYPERTVAMRWKFASLPLAIPTASNRSPASGTTKSTTRKMFSGSSSQAHGLAKTCRLILPPSRAALGSRCEIAYAIFLSEI